MLLYLTIGLISVITPLVWYLSSKFSWQIYSNYLISLTVGLLLGNAFLHLIPESLELTSNTTITGLAIVVGMLFSFLLDEFSPEHDHSHISTDTDQHQDTHKTNLQFMPQFIGLCICRLKDSVLIATSFAISNALGMLTAVGILFHSISVEVTLFELKVKQRLWSAIAIYFGVLALASFLGIVSYLLLSDDLLSLLFGFAAGGFIYLVAADFMVTLKAKRKFINQVLQLLLIFIGILFTSVTG